MVCYYLFAHVCIMARTNFSFPSILIGLSTRVLDLLRNISKTSQTCIFLESWLSHALKILYVTENIN